MTDEPTGAPATTAGRLLLTGRVVTPDAVQPLGAVAVQGERIAFAGALRDLPVQWRAVAVPPGWDDRHTLLPGLVDIHCHGAAGSEFGAEPLATGSAVAHHHRAGTTSVVTSLVSAPADRLVAGATTCAALVASGSVAGIHLEGPFLSMERRGAQNPAALRDVDPGLLDALASAVEAAGAPAALAQMTYAPERPGAGSLPADLARHGMLAALGHTACDATTARAALDRALAVAPRGGRPLVTHAFNGMPPLHHRAPGPVAAALAAAGRGDAVLEVIGDGVHLAAETVRMLFDLVGPQGLCLITDAMAACGMPDGRYSLGGQEVLVEGRTARLAQGGSIAGGVATLLDVVRWSVQEAQVGLHDAVIAASRTPAQALDLPAVGSLEPSAYADVLVVDDSLAPQRVMRRGRWL